MVSRNGPRVQRSAPLLLGADEDEPRSVARERQTGQSILSQGCERRFRLCVSFRFARFRADAGDPHEEGRESHQAGEEGGGTRRDQPCARDQAGLLAGLRSPERLLREHRRRRQGSRAAAKALTIAPDEKALNRRLADLDSTKAKKKPSQGEGAGG